MLAVPDHDTIATFRRRFLKEIEGLFVRVLELAREIGMLKMGTNEKRAPEGCKESNQSSPQRQPPRRSYDGWPANIALNRSISSLEAISTPTRDTCSCGVSGSPLRRRPP
jgi:hypothetical protein